MVKKYRKLLLLNEKKLNGKKQEGERQEKSGQKSSKRLSEKGAKIFQCAALTRSVLCNAE